MTDKDMTQELLLTDCLIRITILEKIIIDAGLITREKLSEDVMGLSSKIAEEIIKKAKSNNVLPNK